MTERTVHGTVAWFDMVGAEIAKAAVRVELPRDLRLSVIERYVDGAELSSGLRQGLRVDVAGGAIAYRTGVGANETADVLIAVTTSTARRLNLLLSTQPAYRQALAEAVSTGELQFSGDLGPLGHVFDLAHDGIVRRTI